MAAAAADGPANFESLLTRGGLDASALDRLADGMRMRHAKSARGDGASFLRAIEELAHTDAQRADLLRQRPHLLRRAKAGRLWQLEDRSEDILFDLARPVGALIREGRAVEANILANRYLDIAPQGATGWGLLPLFVSLHASAAGDGAVADTALVPAPPQLVAIAGLSGTGKSTLSRLLGSRLGRMPGARVLRSDVFRKRLAGIAPEARLPARHYTRASDQETYEAMFESADDHLACGNPVVLDSVFMSRSERDVAEALADRWRAPFTGFWLEAPERDRIERVTVRTGDASDATEAVVREQSRRSVGEIHWHRIRANRPIETIVAAARGALERTR